MLKYILQSIYRGNSLARTMLNFELLDVSLSGEVLDLGAGTNKTFYQLFKSINSAEISSIDLKFKEKSVNAINLEHDKLPHENNSKDYVLMFNLLEHIFNYNYLLREVIRVLAPNGRLIGFVPFLVNIHPDPHDYFRYTNECLVKILENNGFKNIVIKEVGLGPFAVNYNNLTLSLPRFVGVIIFPIYYLLDKIIVFFRPNIKRRFPLGYMFFCIK